jgi:pyruvate dehydrogenase E2 component (dihydrolipoamide acetyltransferase)
MRKTIANRLQESYREAVHVTVHREVDAEALTAAADAADVSVVDVLVRALSDALAEHPAFNATFEDGTHRLYEEHNVGVAVAVEDGLVAPVVADVGGRNLDGIAAERERLTEAVQAGDYTMADLRGGTVTVSNLGPLGVDGFTPIINPPQVAILGVNRVQERARPADEGGVAFRKTLPLDLSFDHRVVDGADAARFLGALAERVEDAGGYVA